MKELRHGNWVWAQFVGVEVGSLTQPACSLAPQGIPDCSLVLTMPAESGPRRAPSAPAASTCPGLLTLRLQPEAPTPPPRLQLDCWSAHGAQNPLS